GDTSATGRARRGEPGPHTSVIASDDDATKSVDDTPRTADQKRDIVARRRCQWRVAARISQDAAEAVVARNRTAARERQRLNHLSAGIRVRSRAEPECEHRQ